VLLNSDRPEVLIQKEDRLGKFVHSRHGVRIVAATEGGVVLQHFSHTSEPAEPTENLASCGQHIAMLEMIGARGLTLRLPRCEEPDRVVYAEDAVGSVPGRDGFDLWHFEWEAFEPTRRPMAGLDELLLDQARMSELQDRPGIAAAVERIVRRDLGRTWPLDRVAKELAMSRRTLQRRLSDAGRTFSDLVLEIRTGEASRLLRDTDLSVTAIGYACGFADTSHFSHTFKNRYGATPGAWKAVAKGES
jgi:AraC-like DNA-binding protein